MYRCNICSTCSERGRPLLRHVINRTVPAGFDRHGNLGYRQEIAKEIPVCQSCAAALKDGVVLSDLIARHRKPPTPLPIVVPSRAIIAPVPQRAF